MTPAAALLIRIRSLFTHEARRLRRWEGVNLHRLDRTSPAVAVFSLRAGASTSRSLFARGPHAGAKIAVPVGAVQGF
jgi:hypothetical protein